MWTGFAFEPDSDASCDLYLTHLKENVCQGYEEQYEYLLNWMADAVQNPCSKPGVAVVLRSDEKGTGKNVAIEYFGKLFGEHYLYVTQSEHLVGKFNSHLQRTSVLFADEAFWAGTKNEEGVLKGLITSPTHMIEPKHQVAYQTTNYIHLMIASNNSWAVPSSVGERRFFVLEVGRKHVRDHKYFAAIEQEPDFSVA